ncbi:unnamed protein product [Urochloa humidicola]
MVAAAASEMPQRVMTMVSSSRITCSLAVAMTILGTWGSPSYDDDRAGEEIKLASLFRDGEERTTGSSVEAGLFGGALLSCVLTSVDTTLASGVSPWQVGAACPCFAAASRPGARGAVRSGRLISSIDNSSMADVRVLVAEGAAGYHLPDHFSGTESGYEIPGKARQCHVATLQL